MALAEVLKDDFANADTGKWQHDGGGAWNAYETVTGGELVLTCRSQYDAHLESVDSFDLTNSYVAVEITGRPAQGGDNSTEMYFGINSAADNNDNATFILTGSGGWVAQVNVNGAEVGGTFGNYNATNHRWLRIRHRAGKLFFEASPDGRTWAILSSVAKPAGLDITSCKPNFQCGYWGTQATPGTAKFDNFNITPYAPDIFMPDSASGTTSAVITTTMAYPAGSRVLVASYHRLSTTTTSALFTCVDSAGNTYTKDLFSVTASGGGLVLYSAVLASDLASGATITVTAPTDTTKSAAISGFVTNLMPSALDKTSFSPNNGQANSTSATYTSGTSAATTQASEIAIGLAGLNIDATGTITNSSGWAETKQANSTGGTNTTNARIYMQHKVLTATGTQLSNPTGTSRSVRGALATYKVQAQQPPEKFLAFF